LDMWIDHFTLVVCVTYYAQFLLFLDNIADFI
jgi:hypothetical protein